MAIIWFTPEADKIRQQQEKFLQGKYLIYKELDKEILLTRENILEIFREGHPDIEDQPYMVRRGEGEGLVIETVRWYRASDKILDFASMIVQALGVDESKR